jgi:hypothetical protein
MGCLIKMKVNKNPALNFRTRNGICAILFCCLLLFSCKNNVVYNYGKLPEKINYAKRNIDSISKYDSTFNVGYIHKKDSITIKFGNNIYKMIDLSTYIDSTAVYFYFIGEGSKTNEKECYMDFQIEENKTIYSHNVNFCLSNMYLFKVNKHGNDFNLLFKNKGYNIKIDRRYNLAGLKFIIQNGDSVLKVDYRDWFPKGIM